MNVRSSLTGVKGSLTSGVKGSLAGGRHAEAAAAPAAVEQPSPRWKTTHVVTVLAVVLACFVIWAWRRPDQLTRPYIWDEETVILADYVKGGWWGALHPVNGYLQLPTALLIALAAQLSFLHLAVLEYVFATGTFLATVVLLVGPRSRWGNIRVRSLMALSMALVPANPEVFGVLLYSFWWTTLWPLIILGWRRSAYWLRLPLLAIAALSSPAGGAVFVLYLLVYARTRRLVELASALTLFAGFVVQVVIAERSPRGSDLRSNTKLPELVDQVLRTSGNYWTRWITQPTDGYGFISFAGLILLIGLFCWACAIALHGRSEVLLLSLGALIYNVVSSLSVALIIDPVFVGRYFFLPFVALGWAAICGLGQARPVSAGRWFAPVFFTRARAVVSAVLVLAFLGLHLTFARAPADLVARLSWPQELRKCAASTQPTVLVPVYVDGSTTYWNLSLTPAQCRSYTG